jgi:hypothetical protein
VGTYCALLIADYPVLSEKSQASAIAMTMFREYDKRVELRRTAERSPIQWGHVEWDPDEMETTVKYTASVSDVLDRLRVLGFTLPRVVREFDAAKARYVEGLIEMSEGSPELWKDEIALLSGASFQDFLAALKEIVTSGIHYAWFSERVPNASTLALYMLGHREDFYWGFPCDDMRCFFRALLEVVPDTAFVTQELTDLFDGGYYANDARVVELASQELKGSYSINAPVVVLTEGPTDSVAIRAALEVLYPHLAGYYSFMDLAVRSPGGAGSLVHVVKSFAGAGIENRVVALFDNDTAGYAAASILRGVTLPPTVRVLHYPDLAFAKRYPTIGPTGKSVQDINGSACSIELYFGIDVLTESCQLSPVQWKGFDDRLRRYQGEIQNKDSLKNRFLTKVSNARKDPTILASQDWSAMRQLLSVLFDAFNA